MISPASGFEAALLRLTAIMANARNDWWVIGSAAVALHRADAGRVADIDVLVSESDAAHILPSHGVPVAAGVADARFVSTLFATYTDAPLPIEFMAGLHRRSGRAWEAVQPLTRCTVAGNGWTVFVPERAELITILRSFGRPKDLRRAAALMDQR